MNNSGEKPKVLLPLYLCQETAPCFLWKVDSEDFTTKTNKLRCWIRFLSVPFFCFPQTWFGSWIWTRSSLHEIPDLCKPVFIHKMGVKIRIYCPAFSQGFNRIPREIPITVLARGRCSANLFFLHFCLLLTLQMSGYS